MEISVITPLGPMKVKDIREAQFYKKLYGWGYTRTRKQFKQGGKNVS